MIKIVIKLQKKFNTMKVKRAIFYLLLSLVSIISIIPRSLANPVAIGPDPLYFQYLFLIFFITLIIEYVIISLFLTKNIISPLKLFKSVFVVNLFTFPVTQIIALNFLIFLPSAFGLQFTAEVFPLIAETTLYLYIYKIADRENELINPIPRKKTIVSTITANLTTFSLGLLILIPYTITYLL